MEGEPDSCSICLESLNRHSVVKLDCNHTFHQKCIFRSISIRNACPLCDRILYVASQPLPVTVVEQQNDRCHYVWVGLKVIAFMAGIVVIGLIFANKI